MKIRCILQAVQTKYLDTRQTMARVTWLDTSNHQGQTVGSPYSHHMQVLLLRALREGVNIVREEF